MLRNLVSKTVSVSALALSALSLCAPAAFANKYNFWISNDTSSDIVALHVSEAWLDDWLYDVTGTSILPSGSSLRIAFRNPSPNECRYDIRAVFANGYAYTQYNVNVCSNNLSSEYRIYEW
jgi:hypothetical protein